MPEYGCPMNVPSCFVWTQRSPSTQVFSDVPADSSGGFDGSIHTFTFESKLPIIASSFLCASPGVAAFCIASIAAFWSIGAAAAFFSGAFFSIALSCADPAPAASTATANPAAAHRHLMFDLLGPDSTENGARDARGAATGLAGEVASWLRVEVAIPARRRLE